jgi:hypothetical protein
MPRDYEDASQDMAGLMAARDPEPKAACDHEWDTGAHPYCLNCGIPEPSPVVTVRRGQQKEEWKRPVVISVDGKVRVRVTWVNGPPHLRWEIEKR